MQPSPSRPEGGRGHTCHGTGVRRGHQNELLARPPPAQPAQRKRGRLSADNGAHQNKTRPPLCKITVRGQSPAYNPHGGQQQGSRCLPLGRAARNGAQPRLPFPPPPWRPHGVVNWTPYTDRPNQRRHRQPAAPGWPRRLPARPSAAVACQVVAPPGSTRPRGGGGTGGPVAAPVPPCQFLVAGA